MKMRHVRIGKDVKVADAVTFMAGERSNVEQAWPGDIIGLHNHGTIQIEIPLLLAKTLSSRVFLTLPRNSFVECALRTR